MTIKQFCEILATTGDWTKTPYGRLRQLGASSPCKRILPRGFAFFCPITAVCAKQTGDIHHMGAYAIAGRRIGLSMGDINRIVKASDGNSHPFDKTRRRIIKACRPVAG